MPNPGYANPLGTATFRPEAPWSTTSRSQGPFAPTTSPHTDLALDWSVPIYRTVELFLHAQVFNIANQQAVVQRLRHDITGLTLAPFNPFTDMPRRA